MSNCYSQIHIHVVFAVQNRASLISNTWKSELYHYIAAIVQRNGNKLLSIGGMPDHVHILFGMRPDQKLSDLVRDIKSNSSKWINENRFTREKFSWQNGYGAFSYSRSQVDNVVKYINTQEAHHKTKTFRDEYIHILERFEVQFDEKYIFHSID